MTAPRLFLLTALALFAFAGNSLLCRYALAGGGIDAASFTGLRLFSGAAMLWLLLRLRDGAANVRASASGAHSASASGNWRSALALFAYAACFSFAYLELGAATGALLLFGAVQATMIAYGLARGERLRGVQWLGLVLALAGFAWLLAPGLSAPPWRGALLMLAAGVAWGAYSLRGGGAADPVRVTAGNFLRSAPMALALLLAFQPATWPVADAALAAVASGALASGLGYALWYAALPFLRATSAAIVQLSVPVLTALGAAWWLGELPDARFALAAGAVLGGIALVTLPRSAPVRAR